MKLLLDQGMPRSTAKLLRENGLDALHTTEIGMERATDREILERAVQEGRIIATFDADFHALLAFSGAAMPSMIRFRLQGLRSDETAHLLREILAQFDEDLQQGAVVTVQEGRVRIRRLPLAPPTP